MTATDVALRCECGKVRGRAVGIGPTRIARLVCMCDDCQAFGHALGRAQELLDSSGGTEVFQTAPARVQIEEGWEQVRCLRLSPRGLLRWHTACCRTALANTLPWHRLPFVGVHADFVDPSVDRDSALGPIRCRVQGRFGIAPLPPDARQRASLSIVARSIRVITTNWLRGESRPNPFFDTDTGVPVVTPTIVDAAERERLRQLCGPRLEG